MSLVTIIADASHCQATKVAGYGFWAVSPRGRHAGGGSFKAQVSSSAAAETMAIVNALHVSISLGIAEKGDKVLVQTDCLVAIDYLQGRVRSRTAEIISAVATFKEKQSTNDLTFEFRHVKGHTRVDDPRSKAQRHADKRARAGMKKARVERGVSHHAYDKPMAVNKSACPTCGKRVMKTGLARHHRDAHKAALPMVTA